jgi:hypothetical protein
MRAWPLALAALVIASGAATTPSRAAASAPDLSRALAFLAAPSQHDTVVGLAPYVVEAVSAAGIDARVWPEAGAPIWDALASYTSGYGAIYAQERVLHAAGSSGWNPMLVDGTDRVAEIRAQFQAGQFGDPSNINDDIWAILALRAAGVPASDPEIQQAATTIEAARAPDGGWAYNTLSLRSDTDITGMALAALADAGVAVAHDSKAISFLDTQAHDNGGYGSTIGATKNGDPDCQSTVWALHAFALLQEAPAPGAMSFLASLQKADGGLGTSPGALSSDAWCTAEAVVLLAGAHYPLPSYHPAHVVGDLHAQQPTRLVLNASFSRVAWDLGALGNTTTGDVTFPRWGSYPYRVLAEGPGTRFRDAGTLAVLSAPPVVVAPGDVAALRHEPLDLDVSGSYDPDGAIASWRVDWGDGNVTSSLSHAYDLPGDRTASVVATDDSGVSSAPAFVRVHVADRAPILDGLPGFVETDRVSKVTLSPNVTDPDGDATTLAWRVDDQQGTGAATLRFATLGDHLLSFTATDPYGAATNASVTIRVEDLPPVLGGLALPDDVTASENVTLRVNASDADGPTPSVEWRIGDETLDGANVTWLAKAGDHDVNVTATDADGATATLHATLHVRGKGAASANETTDDPGDASQPPTPPPPTAPTPDSPSPTALPPTAPSSPAAPLAPPRIVVPANVTAGTPTPLRVELPDGASSAALDLGDGTTTDATSLAHTWATPGTYELRGTARASDGRTSTASVVLRVLAPSPPSPSAEQALKPASASAAPAGAPTVQAMQGSARATPAPGWLAVAALLLAAVGTRASRGRR